ncbi:MAG TPA: hypothetical protein VGK99_15385 [Acidobacteriota bacterium]|jgi:RNA polymerase subunit RPABC4/transcription elongation factor Spt4
MRYCNNCHRITEGDPLFCQFCARSYDVKLCPHRHVNPRIADVCSECGSRDLSTPAPSMGLGKRLLLFCLSAGPGVFLLLMTILLVVGFIQVIFGDPAMLFRFLILALLFGILWRIYMFFPPPLRNLFKSIWPKTRPKRQTPRH